MNALFLRSGIRQGCLMSSLLFNIILEFLSCEIRQEIEIKKHPNWNAREQKLSLFLEMIIYVESIMEST